MSPRLRVGEGQGWAMAALAVLGIALSAYLAPIHYGGLLALCTGLAAWDLKALGQSEELGVKA